MPAGLGVFFFIVQDGVVEVLFNSIGRNIFFAGSNDQYVCNLEEFPVEFVDKPPVPAAEQDCHTTLMVWFCRPTDILCFWPMLVLLGYLTMASRSDKTSDFMDDESPFSVADPGKEEPQKRCVDAV